MHTKQNCSFVENGVSHKPTYCTLDDTDASTELSGMVKNINAQLDSALEHPTTAKVSIAYFSFSNKGVQRKVCELSKKGIRVRVFLDGGSAGTIDNGIMKNSECLDSQGKLNVKLSYLGGQTNGNSGGIWRLHHNKFLMVDPGNGEDVKINFSSGNLSTFGTSLHLDHWVTMVAPANSNLVRAQKCVLEGLEASVKTAETASGSLAAIDRAIAQSSINQREKCFDEQNVFPRVSGGLIQNQIQMILAKEEIAPLFSPNNNSYVEKAFISEISKIPSGGYLYIAIQHFLHPGVGQALIAAANRGVDVRIIMEDGVLKGESEVPGVDRMIGNLRLKAPSLQVRFAETNHNGGKNSAMMHNKLAILNGRMTFSGAGHYTNAALRNNWENFYFVTNKGVLQNYAKYFRQLWEQSVDAEYTTSFGKKPGKPPSPLKGAFLFFLHPAH